MFITRIQGSNPSGATDVPEADPRFQGAQSLHITGTDLSIGDVMFFRGPHGPEGVRLYNLTNTDCDIIAHIPVPGTYACIMASKDGQLSNWMQFQVI